MKNVETEIGNSLQAGLARSMMVMRLTRLRAGKWLIFIFCLLPFALGPVAGRAAPAGPSASASLREGQAALEDELYELAQKKIERYVKTEAHTPAERRLGIILLARALQGQKKYPDMLTLLVSQRDDFRQETLADAFDFWLATAYAELGQWEMAQTVVQGFEQAYPASAYGPYVLRLRARALMHMNRAADAIQALARYAADYSQTPETTLNLLDWGRALVAGGDRAQGRQVLERLQALNLDNRIGQEGSVELGRLYLQEGLPDKARQVLTLLTERRTVPDEYRIAAIFGLADCAVAQTNPVEAMRWLDKGLEQVSDPLLKGEAQLRKGKLLVTLGKVDEGTALVRAFVSSQATNALARDVQMDLAQTLLALGFNAQALAEYQNYLETFAQPEGCIQAYQGKGWALFNLGRYQEAVAAFEKAGELAVAPSAQGICRLKAGDAHFAGEQYKLAVEAYRRVIDQFPETPLADQAQFQVGESLARLGQSAEAEAVLWDLVDRDFEGPLAPRALLRIAQLKQKQGSSAAAQALYQWVREQTTGAPQADALHGLGLLAYQAGRFPEAADYFQQVARNFPTSFVADAAGYLSGWCWYKMGQDRQALDQFNRLLSRYPQSPLAPEALFWLAEYDYNAGAYESAEQRFMTLVKNYPRASLADQALFWAGRAAFLQKEFRRANDHFAALIKDYPASRWRPEARYYQAEALCERGEFAGAILIFDEIIKQFPGHELVEAAWRRKGDSQFVLGAENPKRYAEAIASYQMVIDRPDTSAASRMEAEYKIGRSLEKAGRRAEAFERYLKVVYHAGDDLDRQPQGVMWFTRAAFNAAALKEDEKNWRQAAAIYQRVVDADVPASADAQERIRKIRAEQWPLFY